jgi:Tol biopolymer transport system component
MVRSHICVAALATGAWLAAPPAAVAAPTTVRVSVTNAGGQASAGSGSWNIAVSGSGRFVVFESNAQLVPADTNGSPDIYVRDLVSHTTKRVSVRPNGGQLNDGGFAPVAISRGGRWIAYESCGALTGFNCGTVVTNQTTGEVLPRPFATGAANRAISARGRYVAEDNGTERNAAVVRLAVRSGTHQWASVGVPGAGIDDFSLLAGMSAEGRFILFTHHSEGRPGPSTRVFVRDMTLRRTRLVSVSSSGQAANTGATGNAISGDGRSRMFTSAADNLVAGDTNGVADVFVRVRGSTKTRRINVSSHGRQAKKRSGGLGISESGRFCLFWSEASTLVPGDTNHARDIFVRDLRTHRTFRVDLTSTGGQISVPGIPTAAISADGAWVAWVSSAAHIVGGDTNGRPDVFARGPLR